MASKYREQLLQAAHAFRETGDDEAFLAVADRVILAVSEEPTLPWHASRETIGQVRHFFSVPGLPVGTLEDLHMDVRRNAEPMGEGPRGDALLAELRSAIELVNRINIPTDWATQIDDALRAAVRELSRERDKAVAGGVGQV